MTDELKTADIESLQQHVDAQQILLNLLFSEITQTNPESMQRILSQLRQALDTSPQLHPTLRNILETGYMTYSEMLSADLNRH